MSGPPPPSDILSHPALAPASASLRQGSRRLRGAWYLSVVLLAALVLAQAALAWHFEQARAEDAAQLQRTSRQAAFALEVGRQAALQTALQTATPADLPASAPVLQADIEPALNSVLALAEQFHARAGLQRVDEQRLRVLAVVLTLLALTLLSLAVVEPTARAVDRQVDRQAAQGAELERLALVARHTHNIVLLTDRHDRVLWANEAFTRLSGCTLAEALGRNPGALLHHPDAAPGPAARLRDALARRAGERFELLCATRDGNELWLDVELQPQHKADGVFSGCICVATDITEVRRLQQQLRALARTDTLTGLPNRAVVLERVQRAIHHARRHPGYGFAVLFIDFDRFKQVNDSLGHSAGDALLREVAERLDLALRPGDAVARVESLGPMAARMGGDQFVVVLEGTRCSDDVGAITQRLLEVLALPYQIGPHNVQSGVSVGVVTSEHADGSADAVLRDADTAMHEAKRGGRGRCVFFDRSMHERVVQRLAIETDLRRALQGGELFVVYQPIVDLVSGALTGVEALARWAHPRQGTVAPLQFIGVAEEAGLIDEIGAVVLRTACAQFARWRVELGALAPRRLAVNLSRTQLRQPGLVAEVRAVLEHTGVAPGELQMEVTESLAAQDEAVQAALRGLKALGVKLALDDFGSGYSSLACLHLLPVDTVKIDRCFVSHAETVEHHRVLIEATIRVARTLGMTTVAEGVETPAQAALMRDLQCDSGQGWLYGREMAADELAAWILAAPDRPA